MSVKPLLRLSFITLCIAAFASACQEDRHTELKTPESSDPKIRKLKLPAGFRAERLYSPGEHEQGSWVAMTFDAKGRMIASDQFGFLYRLELPPAGDSSKPKVEKLIIGKDTAAVSMGYAHGLLWAFNSLYVSVNNMGDDKFRKSGLYRLQDTDNDDQFDKISLLKEMTGDGEHGPHSVKLSPDGNSLYVIAGNYTDVPKMDEYRLPSNWNEDNLFPHITDPSGHASDRHAPGGWVAHTDSAGQKRELVSAGFRSAFDLAFNDVGDLFVYDSDMEYDFGMPWYKPTRIMHATSGSEFGWRTGTVTWSPDFPDNLPAMMNVGQGSPTNLFYGREAKFPEKYRKSLFAFDWSFGIIYAIQLKPKGASYTSEAEEFISGAPLPLTDGTIGPDGSLYFLTGGRKLDSDLYRVSYEGNDTASAAVTTTLPEENGLRRKLEGYQRKDPAAVNAVWPYLKHEDRHIRYAARVAIEHQPVSEWQTKLFAEQDPVTIIQAAIAFAHQGPTNQRDTLLKKLNAINYSQLSAQQQFDLLRTYELAFIRLGMPFGDLRTQTIAILDKQYPAKQNSLNRQLSKLLVRLDAPDAVSKTMNLLASAKDDKDDQKTFTESSDLIMRNPQYGLDIASMLSKVPPAQQTYYAVMLSAAKTGWTPELQDRYFKWFYDAFGYKGGQSFVGFIDRARKLALANVPKNKFQYYNNLSGDSLLEKSGRHLATAKVQPKGPGRDWKLEEAVLVTDSGMNSVRNFEQGKNMFAASFCGSCHKMRGEGADVGPDLTQLGTRFSTKDMLEAIIAPSKTVSDQYAATVFTLKNGKTVTGRLISQDAEKYSVSQNPFAPQSLRELPKAEVVNTKLSDVSIMLPGMINRLNSEELKDLMAYLMAGGNPEHPVYKKK